VRRSPRTWSAGPDLGPCLRNVPASTLAASFGDPIIPADIDGSVLTPVRSGPARPAVISPGCRVIKRHHPRRGTALHRRRRHHREPGTNIPLAVKPVRPRELPGQHRPGPRREQRAGRRPASGAVTRSAPNRRRTWALILLVSERELRVPRPAGRPLGRCARPGVRLPVQRRPRAGEHRPADGACRRCRLQGTELPYLFEPAELPVHPPSSAPPSRRSPGACGRPGELRRGRQSVVARRALAIVRQRGAGAVARAAQEPVAGTGFAAEHHASFWAAG